MRILIGNIVSLIASVIMILTGLMQDKKKIIIYQTAEVSCAGLAYLILGSYAGVLDSTIGCIRNILCYTNKLTWLAKFIIIAIYAVLTFSINNMGWAGIVLFFGSALYICFIDLKNSELHTT